MSRPWAAVVPALILVVTVAGCGGGSGDSSTAEVVQAPYSYPVPAGFEETSSTYPGEAPRFATAVVPEGTSKQGYVGVYEVPLSPAQRGLSPTALLTSFEAVERSFYGAEGAALGAGRSTQIGGAKALCWRIHHFKNPYEGMIEADSCAIAGGKALILQTCTWKPQSAGAIQKGCEEVRAGLELLGGASNSS